MTPTFDNYGNTRNSCGSESAGGRRNRHLGARRGVVRCLVMRRRTWKRINGATPQALPHIGRRIQSASCSVAHGHIAPCHGIQHGPREGAYGAGGSGHQISQRGERLYELARMYEAPTSLKALGMKPGDLKKVAELAVQNQYPNPRPLEIA